MFKMFSYLDVFAAYIANMLTTVIDLATYHYGYNSLSSGTQKHEHMRHFS